ncbi:MBL fold metallo-hydrolase [Gloeobacter kilaueensis]|uniref:Zn-dependent hydrolases, including glyoxylase n=1 Tax=Gloeobacter kilaueensis (strain ATCC BAA-2537 / CCAP 1431/1 / ULC 316 / JS1) TaxID=1183438 RepID=U5QP72_GLOK1|nr:MBL fold metallo-hydrolase [Gloeobacter kilaueensis]AGY60693.1 Zn-dependent hydrolases, including glyoxylase [Gloeobacter kilaueensis JS1]
MAKLGRRRAQNSEGEFYVDSSCIDCDTCRWLAPEVFCEAGDQSAVYHQPTSELQRQQALQALLACPTASIGTVHPPQDIQAVQATFPLPVADNVFYCGYHSEASYGAASYLILRPEGNILIDSPRFAPPLIKRLEQLGGVRYLYLTHRDDVAEHQRFREHFGCERILHTADIAADTRTVEIVLEGDAAIAFAPEVVILPVPGHTPGHTVLLYRQKFCFTGDHIAWSAARERLVAFWDYCWYSRSELVRSVEKLLPYRFEWVLPGHGRRYHAQAEQMAEQMRLCLADLRAKSLVRS